MEDDQPERGLIRIPGPPGELDHAALRKIFHIGGMAGENAILLLRRTFGQHPQTRRFQDGEEFQDPASIPC